MRGDFQGKSWQNRPKYLLCLFSFSFTRYNLEDSTKPYKGEYCVVDSYLKLPEKTKRNQIRSKLKWNLEHYTSSPDFYTIGYSGRTINEFVSTLLTAGAATLIDIRFFPVSRYKPEFSKKNLKNSLETQGITYLHRSDWGIPRNIRAISAGKQNRDDIWKWYDNNVLPGILENEIFLLQDSVKQPYTFMCSELDPTECHRHRIFLGLESLGYTGRDL